MLLFLTPQKQLTQPTKGEIEAKKGDNKAIPLEVIQAALDRHRIAEAEFLPMERKILHLQNSAEKMWTRAPPMPNAGEMEFTFFFLLNWTIHVTKRYLFNPTIRS